MQNDLKQLLEEINHYHQSEDVDIDFFNKIDKSEFIPGQKVEIHWKDRDEADKGFLFQLPHQTSDEYDFCVHVTDVDNSDGIDKASEEFHHLYYLVSLDRVAKIKCFEIQRPSNTGVELIVQERKRQIELEGWSLEHDKQHDEGQLADAAAVYAMDEGTRTFLDISWGNDEWLNIWPFELESLKFTPDDRIKELTKAGALIAAEIDRLNSLEENK